jgi:cytochrome c oxidase subunit II
LAEAQGTAPAGFVAEPVVVRTETRWRCIMAGMLGIRLAVGVLTGVFQALHPLRHSESVDPATRHLGGAFVESNLGSAVAPDGVVTVRMSSAMHAMVHNTAWVTAHLHLIFGGAVVRRFHRRSPGPSSTCRSARARIYRR